MKHLLLQGRNSTKTEERLGLLPRICLPTYKPRKGKAKERPFNFLLHRFGIEINQWQMKSTTESKRELKRILNLYLINAEWNDWKLFTKNAHSRSTKKLKRPKILSAFHADWKISKNNFNSKIQDQTNNTNTPTINQV